jgi:gag-polypeptide of LTR copia-type/Zinc knuckle
MSFEQNSQPEGLPSKEEFSRLMERMNQMGEQIKMLTSMGYGPPQSRRENTSQQVEVGSEEGNVLEEVNSQDGIGAALGPATRRSGMRTQPPSHVGGRSPDLGFVDRDLIEERSVASKTGRKRSDTLKPDTMKVFKFDGTDYEIWSKAMGFYLDGAGLWEVVSGDDIRPEDPEELEEWRLVNTKACNVIFSALTRDQQKNVVNCDLAAEMWKTLSQIYARKSMINQAHLIQEYEDYHMKKGVTMMKYIGDIRSFIGKLRGLGVVYPEKSVVLKVLRGLSEEYSVDRKILFNQENLTFEDVCGRLLSEALMSTNNKGSSGQGSSRNPYPAMANVGQGADVKPRGKVCYICKKKGHITKECPHYSGKPGEKTYICFACGQKGHKSTECPKNGGEDKKKSEPGRSNLAVAEEKSTK